MTQMPYGRFPHSTKQISRLVQGTAALEAGGEREAMALYDAIFERGCTAFDTAHAYAGGLAERVLGEWMETRGNREQVFILSKCAHPNRDRNRVTPFDISADLHDSLARLRTDYIDLYLLHRDDTAVPVGILIETFNEHLQAGKLRAFGCSNWTVDRIQEANDYAAAHGLMGFSASSPQFSLAAPFKPLWPGCISISGADGRAEREWYAAQQMPLFVWSSLAAGFFSGRFTPDNLHSFTFYLDKVCVESFCDEANFARLERATSLGREKGLTAVQIAVAYVLNQPQTIFALAGSRSVDEFTMNSEAASCVLSPAEMNWLESGENHPIA